jgi:hypothetical protein
MAVPVAGAAIGSVMKAPRTAQRILSSSTTAKDDLVKLLGYSEDIPNEKWLAGKVEDAVSGGTNSFGVPRRMGSTTGYFGKPVEVPVEILAKLPGERAEQSNVRKDSLDYIRKNWDTVSKEAPYIEVDPFGKAWVSEGNHRIMVAKEKGLKTLPVEIRYFSGGQRNAGELAPEKILEYNLPSTTTAKDDLAKVPKAPKAENDESLNKMLEKSVVKEPVYHASKADVKTFSPEYKTELSSMGYHFGTADQANFRTGQYDFSGDNVNIGKYYLDIKNPLETSHMGSFAPDHLADQMMEMGILDPAKYDALASKLNYESVPLGNALVKILKKNGYDGLKYANEREGEGFSFVPFDATQIKSATGNRGTYDPTTPDITMAKGGEVRKPK